MEIRQEVINFRLVVSDTTYVSISLGDFTNSKSSTSILTRQSSYNARMASRVARIFDTKSGGYVARTFAAYRMRPRSA
jgi:hypothetical protein